MNNREPDPCEQIDYGIGYKAQNSPQQHMTLKIDGGGLAIAIAIIAICFVVAGMVFIPQLAESRANEAVAVATRPISAQVLSAQDRAWLAERNSKMTDENLRIMQADLAARGIKVRLSAHEKE